MALVIDIEGSKEHFSPGQTISGRVCYVLKNPSSMEVKIRLEGEECSRYAESEPTNNAPIKDNQRCKFKFLNPEDAIIGTGYFDIGGCAFSFEFTLPMNIPSSYTGRYGYVKYFIKACVTTDFGEIENENIEFKVFAPIVLKNVPHSSLVPSAYSQEMKIKKWLFLPESMHMYVKLDKTAFLASETINVKVTLANYTSLTVYAILAELYCKVVASVSPPFQEFLSVRYLLARDEGPEVPPNNTKFFLSHLRIPHVTAIPNFQNCRLLTQKQYLKITAMLKDSSKPDLKIKIDVTLGHSFQNVKKNTEGSASRNILPNLLTQIPYPPSQSSSRSSIEHLHGDTNAASPSPIHSQLHFNTEMPQANKLPPYPVKRVSLPYPTSNLCPYPKKDNFPSTVSLDPYLSQNITKNRSHSAVGNVPYPKVPLVHTSLTDVSANAMRSTYIGEGKPPHNTLIDVAKLPRKMPMPSLPTERNILLYPNKAQPPYPTVEHLDFHVLKVSTPNFDTTPPNPPNNPSSATEFVQPMPKPVMCRPIGFNVPTSHSSNLLEDTRPSAPIWLDIQTPSIAKSNETDPFLTDASDTAEAEDKERKYAHQSSEDTILTEIEQGEDISVSETSEIDDKGIKYHQLNEDTRIEETEDLYVSETSDTPEMDDEERKHRRQLNEDILVDEIEERKDSLVTDTNDVAETESEEIKCSGHSNEDPLYDVPSPSCNEASGMSKKKKNRSKREQVLAS